MATLLAATGYGTFVRRQVSKVWIITWLINCKRKSTNISAVDSFISELVENKKLKWKVLNHRRRNAIPRELQSTDVPSSKIGTPATAISFRLSELYNELTNNPLVVDIAQMEVTHVDHLLETALTEGNNEDINLLLEQILQYNKLPSPPVLNAVLQHLSNSGATEKLDQLIALCGTHLPEQENSTVGRFEHYKAFCHWKLGNTSKSLASFRAIVTDCDEEQLVLVDHMLLNIIDETIGKKSEAVLIAVMGLCEFCLEEVKHEFPICYVWEKSFVSGWHSDQEAAKALFDRHEILRKAISKRTQSICYKLLSDNNVEKVYQMIELFLKYDMKDDCKTLLFRLFEYQYWRKNLRGCSEIMQNAIDLNISLPEMCNHHLLELLLGRRSMQSEQHQPNQLKANKYELKF